jgi:hypothetical protein
VLSILEIIYAPFTDDLNVLLAHSGEFYRTASAYLVVELVHVQANLFNIVRHTEVHTRDVLEDHEHDDAERERPGENRANLSKLQADLSAIAIDSTVNNSWNSIQRADFCGGEDTTGPQLAFYCHSIPLIGHLREESATHAANAVELEHFESIIDVKPLVDFLEQTNDDGGDESDRGCIPHGHITSSWGDADQARNSSLTGANDRELLSAENVVEDCPAKNTSGCGEIRVPDGNHAADACIQSATTVESEPSKPDECCAKEHDRDVVGFVNMFLAMTRTLAEDKCICKTCCTRGDVDGTAASEVESAESKQPSIGIPGPVGDRTVADGAVLPLAR